MEGLHKGVYFGIDISDKYTMVSFYQQNMDEPNTISTVVGSEAYQIPTYVAKKLGISQWYYGKEAETQVNLNQATGVENLFSRALRDEMITIEAEVISARDLLSLFLKRLIGMSGRFDPSKMLNKLTFVTDEVTIKHVELFSYVAEKLQVTEKQLMLIDHKESFYYYSLNQDPRLFQQDVMLYDYTDGVIKYSLLQRNQNTRPQIINFIEGEYEVDVTDIDTEFLSIVKTDFNGRSISAVYLVGPGFDGDWLKLSLTEICRGRRAFMGKNLYSKGACYAGAVKDSLIDWPFIYIGDNEMKLNLSLKVIDGNEMKFKTLISAGEPWFDAFGECECILDGTPEIEVWIQKPDSREAKIQVLELTDLPERESRTTRLRISARPTSDFACDIEIKDMGFGDIIPSSGKTFKHSIELI